MKTKLIFIIAFIGLIVNNSKAQNPSFEWARSIGGSSNDYSTSITTDIIGNVYTIGYFQGTVDFDPGAGLTNLTSVGQCDLYIQKLDASGSLIWVKQMGETHESFRNYITIDNNGNIYTTGNFDGTSDFDPGAGITNLTSAGYMDIYIQKLDASGNLLWVKQMGGADNDYAEGVATDNSGNVYTTGHFTGTVDFDPGVGTVNFTSTGYQDIYIQKLDTSGNLLWVKQIGGLSNYDAVSSITTDIIDNVYITGHFRGTVDFDPGVGTVNLTSMGDYDIYIQKLDALGNLLWVKQIRGIGPNYGLSITTDNICNVYTTGSFMGTADFDPGAGTTNLTPAGHRDVFIQKLDVSGNLLWVKQMGGSVFDEGWSITTDYSGNVYTTGWFSGIADFDPGVGTTNLSTAGDMNIFIQKLDPSGNLLWVKQMGGSNSDRGNSITIDNSGNVYTVGFFRETADFDPDTGTANLISAGGDDIFIQKLGQCFVDMSLTLNDSSSVIVNETGATYQWLDCNNSYTIISGATNQSYNPTISGSYAVEVSKNGCVDTSICIDINIVSIIENSFGDEFNFFPNPTSGKVNLELGANYENVQINIRNSEGKLLKQQQFSHKQNISLEIVGVNGIYVVEILSANKRALVKVVKQ